MATKTGLNAAIALRDRQDNRLAKVVGVVLCILFLLSFAFGNEREVPVIQGLPGEVGLADIKDEPHPLVAYSRGRAQEIDARLESIANASGR